MMKAIFLLATAVALGGCARQQAATNAGPAGETTQASATPVSTQSTATPAMTQVDSPRVAPVYVDVRTPAEFAAGHVTGAINIPYDQMPQRWSEIDSLRTRPVVLYCRTGHRAGIALAELQQLGFTGVVNGGGLEGLMAQGVPVTRSPAP